LFFLTCDGSPTSREEYPEGIVGDVKCESWALVLVLLGSERSRLLIT
jgi:hypothetical protein